MPSVDIPIAKKICVLCGQDVARVPRTKDKAGRYYCNPCYEQLKRQGYQEVDVAVSPPAAANPAPLCRSCGVDIGYSEARTLDKEDCRARAGTDTVESPPALICGSSIAHVQEYIRTTNWLLVAAIFTGIFLAPIGVVMQVICMRRLLRLANRPRQWGWLIPAALPLIGLVPVKLMADRAGKVVHKPLNSIRPLDHEQRRRFRQLLTLQSIAWIMAVIPWLASWITVGGVGHRTAELPATAGGRGSCARSMKE